MFRLTTLVSALLLVQFPSASCRQVPYPRLDYEPCRGQESGKFVKDRYACDKFFYCDPNHVAISVDCPDGMIFNEEEEICDFPWNHVCVPERREEAVTVAHVTTSTMPATRRTSSATAKQTIKPTSTTRPPQTTHATSTPSLPLKESHCPAEDSSTLIFLSDKTDCHRYYICYHGHPMPVDCSQQLHWNPRLERCDFPETAGCLFTATATVMPPLITTVSAVKAAVNCPVRGEVVLPHPEECNYFIYCVNGFATVQQCPFFHHFDVQSKSCVWQTVAKCSVDQRKPRA